MSNGLEKNWRHIIGGEFDIGDYVAMEQFLQGEEDAGHPFYPEGAESFNALNLTPFEKVKVVIIGQDPYHGEGEAHGLCFSTKGSEIPPSLRNIYEEIEREYGEKPRRGDLTRWAKQGVLLLNATLTVQKGSPRSHEGKGWEKFTDAIIRAVNEKSKPVVFLLWGRQAQKKGTLITDRKKHLVLEASHPSGFSAYRSFLDSGHFKRTNAFLREQGLKPVDWERI